VIRIIRLRLAVKIHVAINSMVFLMADRHFPL
jgi:hypothetical protein